MTSNRDTGPHAAEDASGAAPVAAFGRVMIAVDKSATSEWALAVGGRLAARLGAAVALTHVVDVTKGFAPEFGVLDDRILDELKAAGEQLLQAAASTLPAGLTVTRVLREGDPATAVVTAAREWRADLLVVGTHAHGVIAKFLLGSTAEAVVRRAHCPVVTVGHQPSGLEHQGVGSAARAPEAATAGRIG
jgi:nucleotide-binding universal stress UspA family protein